MNIRIKSENGMVGLELPCREEKIAEFCKKLDISNNSKTEVTVDYVYLNDRANGLHYTRNIKANRNDPNENKQSAKSIRLYFQALA